MEAHSTLHWSARSEKSYQNAGLVAFTSIRSLPTERSPGYLFASPFSKATFKPEELLCWVFYQLIAADGHGNGNGMFGDNTLKQCMSAKDAG